MNCKGFRKFLLIFLTSALVQYARASANYQQCIARINNMTIDGKMDNRGHPLPPSSDNATAITYDLCVSQCGPEQEPFQWSVFSQQFSAWLLPWLALISQLPFGANDAKYNLESMFLAVGSPTLAAYSLSLTTLNGRWIRRRFGRYRYPNIRDIVQVLSSLQQSPLRIHTGDEGLASLIILPQNDQWWEDLVKELEYTQPYTWSISSVTSIAWVLIAYIFTLVDYFSSSPVTNVETNGGSVGTLWLWLLPVVFGWLRISPKCDSDRLQAAIDKANCNRYVADALGRSPSRALTPIPPINLDLTPKDNARFHECVTAPIFNYARYLPWVQAVMEICDKVDNVCRRNLNGEQISPGITFDDRKSGGWDQLTARQVIHYCSSPTKQQGHQDYHYPPYTDPTQMPQVHASDHSYEPLYPQRSISRSNYDESNTLYLQSVTSRELGDDATHVGSRLDGLVWSRMLIASFWALLLQWGTTGAAIIIVIFTPTIGLGCRSLSFVVYGAASTIAWLMLLMSSILVFYSTDNPTRPHSYSPSGYYKSVRFRGGVRFLAICLRLAGKGIAAVNALLILATSVFQFSGFYDRCYCDSSVTGLKQNAYNVITLLPSDGSIMLQSWAGGCALSILAASFFAFHVWLLSSPST